MIKTSRFATVLSFVLLLAACNKPAPPTASPTSTSATPADSGVKRYHLTGRVVSSDKRANSVLIDGDDVPGFMGAMTMPYTVKEQSLLDKLTPGDRITADIVVKGDDSWLENVVVTGHTTPPKPTAEMHIPAAGDAVPNFRFVNQDNRPISLHQYRGQWLLLTFIYTRCPFPDFCPRLSHQFAEINRQLANDPALYRKTRLLSISFDPVHDTPKVLRAYAYTCSGNKSPALFHHWEFAAPRPRDLAAIANFFGLEYQKDGVTITHSLSTTVIGPSGHIFKWYHGSDWQPADLIKDAADSLHAAS
jgi:protein SCO1/2